MSWIENKQDIDRVRQHLRDNYNFGDMYALLFTFGCNFGLRASDLRKLTFGHIRNKTHLQIIEKKTGKPRKIFINGKSHHEFNKYIDGHKYNNSIVKYLIVSDSTPIFISRKNVELDEKSIYRIIRTACENISLTGDFGSHTMRKTFAYHCYKLTPDLNIIKRLLLHSDLSVTKKYVDSKKLQDFAKNDPHNSFTDISDDEIYSALNL